MNKVFDVVNLHLTEKCNYRCQYCFAVFKPSRELDLVEWKRVVDLISDYFESHLIKGRINLAGGEPTLVGYLDELIMYIHQKGIEVSIITNGSSLSKEMIDRWVGKVSMIGVSIDSIHQDTNRLIGKCQRDKTLVYESTVEIFKYIKSGGIRLKINTVVSRLNLNEDVVPLYNQVAFERIKILQVRFQENCNEEHRILAINNDEFLHYINRVQSQTKSQIIIESSDSIEASYFIIDPEGFLISNSNQYHLRVGNVLEYPIEELIDKAGLNYHKFESRYDRMRIYG